MIDMQYIVGMELQALYADRERFIRLAKALIARRYPYIPQRRAIAAKMYSNWIKRNARIKEETDRRGETIRKSIRRSVRVLHKRRDD